MKRIFSVLRPFIIMTGIVLLFVLCFYLVDALTRNKEPQPAPDFMALCYDESSLFSLSENFGQTGSAVVFFDPADEKSALHLAAVMVANGDRADVIGVSVSKEPFTAQKEQIEKYDLSSARILFDHEEKVAETYGISGVPVTYFIDKDGRIREAHLGGISAKTLEKCFQKIA